MSRVFGHTNRHSQFERHVEAWQAGTFRIQFHP